MLSTSSFCFRFELFNAVKLSGFCINSLSDKPGLLTQKPRSVTILNNSNLKQKEEAESTVKPIKRTLKHMKKSEDKL